MDKKDSISFAYGNFENEKSFRSFFQRVFIAPVYVHIVRNNISIDELVRILESKGYKYQKTGIISTFGATNRAVITLRYFINMYNALEINMNDEEILQAYYKMIEIKRYKKENNRTKITAEDRAKLFPKQ
jgi:hypothetical protein